MRQTKILMTADTVGGVWTYALELIEALRPGSPEVVLATMGAPLSTGQSRTVARMPRVTVCESHYQLEWMEDPWTDVDEAGKWLLDLAETFDPDLIHLNNYAHGPLPWPAPVLMVGHSCVLSWWEAVKGEAAPPEWGTYRRRVRAGLQAADLVVAPTQAMLKALQRHYGPLSRTRVIYNGRAPEFVRPGTKADYIFAVGRLWDEAKNVAVLDQIAPTLPWPVYVAGDQRHPVNGPLELEHVHPLGRLSPEDLRHWLARASIYALPARYEPFGLSALEAALAGCALVLGDIDSLREVWGDAACYVHPDDADGLRETLQTLIQHPARRTSLAAAARRRARDFVLAPMGVAYWQSYRQLLSGMHAADKVRQTQDATGTRLSRSVRPLPMAASGTQTPRQTGT